VTVDAASGSVRVCNKGGYVAKFYLDSLTKNGESRSYESGIYPIGSCLELQLPREAVWGRVRTENMLFFGIWREIFRQEFTPPIDRCYSIWGSTFHPSWGDC
ncbi:unnamed protein product, partial [Didymodactylos carnosus]